MSVEFWGLVLGTVTGFGGFGLLLLRLSYSLGRQTEIQDGLLVAVKKLSDDHNSHVNQDTNHFQQINERLAEGSKKMALFDERQQVMQQDLKENFAELKQKYDEVHAELLEMRRMLTDDRHATYRPKRRDKHGRFVAEAD